MNPLLSSSPVSAGRIGCRFLLRMDDSGAVFCFAWTIPVLFSASHGRFRYCFLLGMDDSGFLALGTVRCAPRGQMMAGVQKGKNGKRPRKAITAGRPCDVSGRISRGAGYVPAGGTEWFQIESPGDVPEGFQSQDRRSWRSCGVTFWVGLAGGVWGGRVGVRAVAVIERR